MVEYNLESLGPDLFQKLCQALLVHSFPDTRCFPIGQADGGRDAVVRDTATVYQVKYVRDPSRVDAHKKVAKSIKDELPKVQRLISAGRSPNEYIVVTNVQGTGPLEKGSIDLVDEELRTLPVPATCWWRDDVARRLDDAWHIKWRYPSILHGPDVLRLLLRETEAGDAERRARVLTSFLASELERDRKLRFQQVDLESNLDELFTDVPLRVPIGRTFGFGRPSRSSKASGYMIEESFEQHLVSSLHEDRDSRTELRVERGPDTYEWQADASKVLLAEALIAAAPFVVLEGGPGQGKSTITQYLCQWYRQRILRERDNDSERGGARVPFRIDCRDLSRELLRSKSVEEFLSEQVSRESGGASFDVDDVREVVRLGFTLIVFDGLDEVADTAHRTAVVRAIEKFVTRHHALVKPGRMQVIVTTRPSAIAEVEGPSKDRFLYLPLGSLTQDHMEEYAGKWIKAKRLQGKQSAEVRRILKEKLHQPHLRELARNPMQLTILLSLVKTRGASLPEKRTALYDSYMRLFFDREAEKSEVVRSRREVLLEIHQVLAWHLHSEAQLKSDSRGKVSIKELMSIVGDYLSACGHPPDLVDQLFAGVTQRIVALVSREEGFYEFEVQPLREYFAARHLYETKRYSPVGNVRGGTLPDRFKAMARDGYWTNTLRFYCGCYDRGELESIVACLEELAEDELLSRTTHLQGLAAQLLADWIFSQKPRILRRVVDFALTGLSLRFQPTRHDAEGFAVLPPEGGQAEMISRCLDLLQSVKQRDFRDVLTTILRRYQGATLTRRLLDLVVADHQCGETWVEVALHTGTLANMSEAEHRELTGPTPTPFMLRCLWRAGHFGEAEADEERFRVLVNGCLDGASVGGRGQKKPRLLAVFGLVTAPHAYLGVFDEERSGSLRAVWRQERLLAEELDAPAWPLADQCKSFVSDALDVALTDVDAFRRSLEPWMAIVGSGVQRFGERWAFMFVAALASGIRNSQERGKGAIDLLDGNASFVTRARLARMRPRASRDWGAWLERVEGEEMTSWVLLLFFAWASKRVLVEHLPIASARLEHLNERSAKRVVHALRIMCGRRPFNRTMLHVSGAEWPADMSPCSCAAVVNRLARPSRTELWERHLEDYQGEEDVVLEVSARVALEQLKGSDADEVERWLAVLRRTYTKGVGAVYLHRLPELTHVPMSLAMAKTVVDEADRFPTLVVRSAERICRLEYGRSRKLVGVVAKDEDWFGA